jgi:hypothetical protein
LSFFDSIETRVDRAARLGEVCSDLLEDFDRQALVRHPPKLARTAAGTPASLREAIVPNGLGAS